MHVARDPSPSEPSDAMSPVRAGVSARGGSSSTALPWCALCVKPYPGEPKGLEGAIRMEWACPGSCLPPGRGRWRNFLFSSVTKSVALSNSGFHPWAVAEELVMGVWLFLRCSCV